MSIDGSKEGSEKSAEHVRSTDRVSEKETIGDNEQNSLHKQAKAEYMKTMHDGSCGGMPVPGRADIASFQIVDGNEPIASTRPVNSSADGSLLAQKMPDKVKKFADGVVYPHRDSPDQCYDNDAANLAANKLSRFSWFMRRGEPGFGPNLVKAIIRNEANEYMRGKDDLLQDVPVKLGGKPLIGGTTGPGQVSINNQMRLAKKFPELLGKESDYPAASTNPYFATLLAGCLMEEAIETFEKWDDKKPDEAKLDHREKLLFKHAYPAWQQGRKAESLIRSYNPGAGIEHVENVRKNLRKLSE